MRSKAELFKTACERNALRREAQLPLIDVKEDMEKERRNDMLDAWNDAVKKYDGKKKEFYEHARAEILAETGKDFNNTVMGKRAIAMRANPKFQDYLIGLGYKRP